MRYRYRTDEEMKDSGVEWIGKIPKDWQVGKFKYSSLLYTGNSIKDNEKDNYTDSENSYPYISTKDINIDYNTVNYSNGMYTKTNDKTFKIANKDSILICIEGGSAGRKISYLNQKVSFVNKLCCIQSNKIDSKYQYYYCNSDVFKKEFSLNMSGLIGGVSVSALNNFRLVNPSLLEQEKIANFLDEKTSQFDLIISKKEKLIERLEEAKKSLISEVVTGKVKVVKTNDGYELVKRSSEEMKDSGVEWLGDIPMEWEVIKIKRLSRIGRGASPRPIDNPIYFDEQGEYAWTRISDVSSSGKYLNKTTQRVSELGASLSVKLEPNKLFLSIAASVGKPCITKIKACIHDGFVYFPDLKEYLNDYLYYVFYGEQCYKGLGKLGTQLNLNRETVGDIKIGLSNKITEVYYIIAFLQQELVKIDNLINKTNLQIKKLKEAKQSLISEAVTGKIEILD